MCVEVRCQALLNYEWLGRRIHLFTGPCFGRKYSHYGCEENFLPPNEYRSGLYLCFCFLSIQLSFMYAVRRNWGVAFMRALPVFFVSCQPTFVHLRPISTPCFWGERGGGFAFMRALHVSLFLINPVAFIYAPFPSPTYFYPVEPAKSESFKRIYPP